jgi:predicted RND superfamily exporter protein
VLLVAILLAVWGASLAINLKIDTDIANLLPPDNPHVVALDKLRDTIGGETEMDVAIGSPDFEQNIAFANALIERSLELTDPRTGNLYFNRVEFRKDTEILRDYALYLATDDELDELVWYLEDEIENAKIDANPFFVDFGFEDDEEVESTNMDRFQEVYDELIPSEYPVNADSTVVSIKFYPSGSKSDLSFLRRMFDDYGKLIEEVNPSEYHPEMKVLYGGRLKRHLTEIESITNDVFSSFSTGVSSVLLLVMFYFFFKKYINYKRGEFSERTHTLWSHIIRMPVSIIIIGIPLLLSLAYTFGITYLVFGTLNTMTSVLFVILFGLGIDYGIHFYARYLERRSVGDDVLNALMFTYDSTGSAILTSAVTTSVALFVLVFADFRGFSEFGFISSLGIMLAYFCMIYVLPSIITIFERFGFILVNRNTVADDHVEPAHRYPFSRAWVISGFAVIVLVITFNNYLNFEYDFGKLEPEFEEFEAFREFVGTTSSGSRRNPAYIIADDNDQVRYIVDEIRARKEFMGEESTIMDVEALQERFPQTHDEEQEKLRRIEEVRTLLQDPFIRDQKSEDLQRLRRASRATSPLNLNDLPDFIRDRYLTKDGEVGRFVTIYPAVGLSDGRNSIAFKNEIASVETPDGNEFFAASTSIAAAEMLELMQTESPYMVTATFIMIFILVNLAFRSIRWSIISMIPLLVGLGWTFGIMILFDINFNFYNLVVLPAILGIGNDNGVHLAARYLEEGRNSMWSVLKSTGQHVSIGSLTTMMGFAGLLFTSHPGLYSIGILAVTGIGMTLFSALTFLPALIQWLEDRNLIKFYDQPIR